MVELQESALVPASTLLSILSEALLLSKTRRINISFQASSLVWRFKAASESDMTIS